MLAVVDWGAPGVPVVARALTAAGGRPEVVTTARDLARASRIVLPGVGDWSPARRRLSETGFDDGLRAAAEAGRPVLAICLGFQLCCAGMEGGESAPGLGLLPGRIIRFRTSRPLPHVAWATVTPTTDGRAHAALMDPFAAGSLRLYHVHSYHATDVPVDATLATADYDGAFPTIVGRGSVLGVQFHPEQSRAAGITFLRGFLGWAP